jgi:hypothetical protein
MLPLLGTGCWKSQCLSNLRMCIRVRVDKHCETTLHWWQQEKIPHQNLEPYCEWWCQPHILCFVLYDHHWTKVIIELIPGCWLQMCISIPSVLSVQHDQHGMVQWFLLSTANADNNNKTAAAVNTILLFRPSAPLILITWSRVNFCHIDEELPALSCIQIILYRSSCQTTAK